MELLTGASEGREVWRIGDAGQRPGARRTSPQVYGPQIICHNDLSPPNTVYAPGRAPVFIDWDLAGPAPALWDVVSAARSFVPLYVDADCERIGMPVLPRGPRLKLFCDAYGLAERDAFLPLLRGYLRQHDRPNTRRTLDQLDVWQLNAYLE